MGISLNQHGQEAHIHQRRTRPRTAHVHHAPLNTVGSEPGLQSRWEGRWRDPCGALPIVIPPVRVG